ncbi:electron transfer flavoprotein subunit beta/FixA family protein|uniref:Electron transfer flavoprotein small subunit n=1 Tax=Dendrosporobacter quercicolus TaxID=146817 RepID=A0A1G9ZZB7_9FIRM|nr:electron transfer flavoprotein subunit beta/FixA family protein [Dendrosporobacter quercicolus]NSL50088.1 electron transfer flavoprotein subunit beta/FixA family protein [Dendrosporobacter quercicolus DSM 1736]SDN26700.1 electron transfer flavoprotein beta subunit [Dendrosporobacter quercicolus]
MGLNIAVCIKSVPDPNDYDKITIDMRTKTITRTGIPTIVNPADKSALEAALQVKEKYGGKVVVFCMAPPEAKSELYEAMAMGADEAVLLSDRAFAGADTLATSYTLAQGIKQNGAFDLVFTGTESADGATAQVPSQLAEWLGIAHLWNVKEFAFNNDREIQAKVKLDNAVGEYVIKLPALLAVAREANKPRYTSAMGVMKARKKPLAVLGKTELKADESLLGQQGSPTWPGDIAIPSMARKGQQLTGTPEEIAVQIFTKLRAAGINLVSKGGIG